MITVPHNVTPMSKLVLRYRSCPLPSRYLIREISIATCVRWRSLSLTTEALATFEPLCDNLHTESSPTKQPGTAAKCYCLQTSTEERDRCIAIHLRAE